MIPAHGKSSGALPPPALASIRALQLASRPSGMLVPRRRSRASQVSRFPGFQPAPPGPRRPNLAASGRERGKDQPVVEARRPPHARSQSLYSKQNQEKPRNNRGSSSSELPPRCLAISTPDTGKQKSRLSIHRGLACSRAAGDRRPMRSPNFPLAIFFDIHLRCSRPVIAHSGTTFRGHRPL